MKIFLSWSGDQSRHIAIELEGWLKCILNATEPFVSAKDIHKGRKWLVEISENLEHSDFGIVCLTPENFTSPWILFEAGALSKKFDSNVCTLLTGKLTPEKIEGPLSHLQHTQFEKEDFWNLLLSINNALKDKGLDSRSLRRSYDKWWPDLEEKVKGIFESWSDFEIIERPPEDMIKEILELTRYIARSSRELEFDVDTGFIDRLRAKLHSRMIDFALPARLKKCFKEDNPKLLEIAQMNEGDLRANYDMNETLVKMCKDFLDSLGLSLDMKMDNRLL